MKSTLLLSLMSVIWMEVVTEESVAMTTQNVSGCPPPALSPHMEAVPSLAEYPHDFILSLTCGNGSVLVGQSTVTCLLTGNWSGIQSYCADLACDVPEIPDYGSRSFYKDTDSSQIIATYSCGDKYQLLGKASSQCEPDGNWTEPVPTCSRTCAPAVVPLNGSVHMECSYHNCTALFMCHEGYTLAGDKMSQCIDGVWVHEHIPTCQKTYCPPPPQVNNSVSTVNISQESFPYGVTVTYSCVLNFTLHGNRSLRCGRQGQWLGQVPSCVVEVETTEEPSLSTLYPESVSQVTCPPPPPLPHGQYMQYDTHTLLYKCDYGFTLSGDKERTCQQNGTWSSEPPACVRDPASNGTASTSPTDLNHLWRDVFLEFREWEGTYVWREKATRFKLWVLENKHPHTPTIEGLFIDNQDAKLHITVSYRPPSLHFEMSRLIERSERFTPGHKWAFDGFLRKHKQRWQLIASVFQAQPGFQKLRMSPKKEYSPPPIPHFTEQDLSQQSGLKAVALALGLVIAIVAILLAAALAAFLVRRKAMKAGGHRSVTSFENPVYDYQNSLKAAEQQERQQEPTDC